MIFPCVLPRQLEPIYSLFINCILYFLSRSFELNSRNLEMNVNSVEVTNFRQILTSRAINYGNVRFISSRDLTKYFANMLPSLSISAQGRGEETFQLRQVYAFKIWTNVLQEESSQNIIRLVGFLSFCCWYSIRPLLVQRKLFSILKPKVFITYSLNSQSGNNFTFVYLHSGFSRLCTSPFESRRLYLKLSSFCSRYIYFFKNFPTLCTEK